MSSNNSEIFNLSVTITFKHAENKPVLFSDKDLEFIKDSFEYDGCITQFIPLKNQPGQRVLVVRKGLNKIFDPEDSLTNELALNYYDLRKDVNKPSNLIPDFMFINILKYFPINPHIDIQCNIGAYYDTYNRFKSNAALINSNNTEERIFVGFTGKTAEIILGTSQDMLLDHADIFVISSPIKTL